MKLLKEISEKDLGFSDKEILNEKFIFRKVARAILLNEKNEICLQYLERYNFYKLPGGGVERGESIEEGLRREIIEEVGCYVKIERDIGIVLEYRNLKEVLLITYCYLCTVEGDIGEPAYTKEELRDGQKNVWVSLDRAIELLNNFYPEELYKARFIISRDKTFLEEYKNNII